ncbi:cation-translocating P-type ATPase [Dellaglioa sp. P0083]|uniref:cation-translocating P-type ATPase n=1 Tax=Dellaglioa kimchii TaxID=3344667 RepID=UPI0038D4CF30
MTKRIYAQSVDEVLAGQKTDLAGLTTQEVKERTDKYGLNQLSEGKRKTILQKFFDQFKDFMIIVLIVAALIAASSGEVVDAIIIMLVVVLNAVFGVFQESKAEEAINALKEMSTPNANVKRNGQIETVKSENLVPGDIVLLEAGDVIPADLRLTQIASLKIEESALTGESVPVDKSLNLLNDEDAGIGDRHNMAFMNSNVTYGRGEGIVVGTGMNTEVGRIAGMLNSADEMKTPLQDNLNQLGKTLTILILIIAVIVFFVGLQNGDNSVIDMLLIAISLAVAAIPEGLPAIVTIILALGTQKMAKRNAIVRKLPAVETLGSTDIIASDKTGTLTLNQMTVEKIFINNELLDAGKVETNLESPLYQVMSFSNDTKQTSEGNLIGDPTETALIQYHLDHGLDVDALLSSEPRVAEVPFDSERKLMSTIQKVEDKSFFVAVKGAPDQLLKRVTRYIENGEIKPITDAQLDYIMTNNHDMATQALRVLAFAYREMNTLPEVLDSETVENDLIFAGLVGMIDPERPEAAAAVSEAKKAGIRPLMITGDHRDTAEAIAVRLGIVEAGQHEAIISGSELDDLSDSEFENKVEQYSVYARVSPEHKVRIVKAWQKKNQVVAMTGDGVNDAPALKSADIGIGMGITGTEVSKGASDMVLADDNFATIVFAVKEGRKVFSNIQKSIQYLLSANLGEVLTLFVMTMMGWSILAPVHILWINLVTDTFPAIALGVEPAEKGLMDQKPRGRKSNFFSGGVMPSIIYQGILEGAITLFVYWLALTYPVHMGDKLIHADALTMAFATLGLIQLFHAFNVKSIHGSIFNRNIFKNVTFNWSILASFALLAATILIPGLNKMFHVSHLDMYQWGIVLAGSFSIIVIVEIVKLGQRLFRKNK